MVGIWPASLYWCTVNASTIVAETTVSSNNLALENRRILYMVDRQFIEQIPKAELHLHLEGTLEPDLKLQLAQKNNIDIGQDTIEEVKASYQFTDLTSFLAVYYPAMNVLQQKEDFTALANAYLARVKEQNVRYVEVFFDPQAHTSRGVAFEDVIDGYYDAISNAKENYGIDAQLIMCFLRDLSEESAIEHYEMALPHRSKFIGIGLDSDERNNPPRKFERVFARAKADGFKITMHCDIDQVGSINNIHDALHVIGVDRIDHGTNIVEDPALVDYAIKNGIGLTCCPVSNSFVTDDMKAKEMKELLHQGVKVTINSDDPAYFQSYVADDLYAVAKKAEFNQDDVVQLVKNAFEIAWIDEDSKAKYLKEVDEFVAGWKRG